jgi:S1-C subfamily serine protease
VNDGLYQNVWHGRISPQPIGTRQIILRIFAAIILDISSSDHVCGAGMRLVVLSISAGLATLCGVVTAWADPSAAPETVIAIAQGDDERAPAPTKPQSSVPRRSAHATGFFVSPEGLLITAKHVVRDCPEIRIYSQYNVDLGTSSIVAAGREFDIALLELDRKPQARSSPSAE